MSFTKCPKCKVFVPSNGCNRSTPVFDEVVKILTHRPLPVEMGPGQAAGWIITLHDTLMAIRNRELREQATALPTDSSLTVSCVGGGGGGACDPSPKVAPGGAGVEIPVAVGVGGAGINAFDAMLYEKQVKRAYPDATCQRVEGEFIPGNEYVIVNRDGNYLSGGRPTPAAAWAHSAEYFGNDRPAAKPVEMPVISPDEPVQLFWPNDVQVVQAPAVENPAVDTVSAERATEQVSSDVHRVRAVYPFAHCRGELTGVVIGFHEGDQFKRLSDYFCSADLAWADAASKLTFGKCFKCSIDILAGDMIVRDGLLQVWCADCWADRKKHASDFDAKADVQK